MFPNSAKASASKSTRTGGAVLAFPDVCWHPDNGKPIPAPYPNAAKTVQAALPPALVAAGISVAGANYKESSSLAAQTLRTRLSQLNNQLQTLPGNDPNRWHELVDEYVQTTATLYKTLAASKTPV
jgi:hypothetical protein